MEESFSFGRFRASATRRELWADGRPVTIGARALDLLISLLRRPGELVTKDELIQAAWAGIAVEDNAIAAQVAAVRRALGEAADGVRYVQTVPGRGYRFVAEVSAGDRNGEAAGGKTGPAEATSGRAGRRRITPVLLAAAAAVIVAASAGLLWRARIQGDHAKAWSEDDPRGTFVMTPARIMGDPELATYADQFEKALAARFNPALGELRLVPSSGPGSQQGARYAIGLDFSRSATGVVTRVTLREQESGRTLGVNEFPDAVVLSPSSPPTFPVVWRASALIKNTAVRHEAERAVARPPGERDARDLVFMAEAAPLDRQHNDEALAWMEAAYRAAPQRTIVRRGLAMRLDLRAFNGWSAAPAADLARVRALDEGLLNDDPNDVIALATLANSALLEARWEEALAATDRLLSVKPDDIQGLLGRLQSQLELGRFRDAEQTYVRALPFQAPRFEVTMGELGGLLRFHEGRWAEAASLLRRAILATPREDMARPAFAGLKLYLAAAEAFAGQNDEARRDLKDFLSAVPAVRTPADFWRWNDSVRLPLVDRDKLTAGLAKAGWRDPS